MTATLCFELRIAIDRTRTINGVGYDAVRRVSPDWAFVGSVTLRTERE